MLVVYYNLQKKGGSTRELFPSQDTERGWLAGRAGYRQISIKTKQDRHRHTKHGNRHTYEAVKQQSIRSYTSLFVIWSSCCVLTAGLAFGNAFTEGYWFVYGRCVTLTFVCHQHLQRNRNKKRSEKERLINRRNLVLRSFVTISSDFFTYSENKGNFGPVGGGVGGGLQNHTVIWLGHVTTVLSAHTYTAREKWLK